MVKVGVIGAGDWGRNHLRVYSKLDCELVGVADTNREIEKLAKKYGVKFFSNYRRLLENVEAVSVVAPTRLHYEIVKECLSLNKHVLVEKPITLNSKHTRELINIANSRGLILQIGYLYRFNSAVLKLKELISEIGDIQYITSRYVHSSKPPRKDSGAIFNFAVHMFDTLTFLLDKIPASVYAKKLNYLSKIREDAAIIILDYKDFFVSLEVSWLHPLKKRDLWIIATREKLSTELLEQSIRRYPKIITYDKTIESSPIDVELHKNEPLFEELKYFINCAESSKSGKETNARDNRKRIYDKNYIAAILCELAMNSAKLKKEIRLNC
jgi:UDP-N-acetylglucosamine 3-dehydrogenase